MSTLLYGSIYWVPKQKAVRALQDEVPWGRRPTRVSANGWSRNLNVRTVFEVKEHSKFYWREHDRRMSPDRIPKLMVKYVYDPQRKRK